MSRARRSTAETTKHPGHADAHNLVSCWLDAAAFGERTAPSLTSIAARNEKESDMLRVEKSAVAVVFRDSKRNGFGAQVLRMAAAAGVARRARVALVIALDQRWNYGCGWSCFFLQPTVPHDARFAKHAQRCANEMQSASVTMSWNLSMWSAWLDQEQSTTGDPDNTRLRESPGCVEIESRDGERFAHREMMRTLAELPAESAAIRFAADVRSVWRLNEPLKREVDAQLQRLRVESSRFVAVHLRRGDKSKDAPFVPLENYVRAITWALRYTKQPAEMVYITGDDCAAVIALEARVCATLNSVSVVRTCAAGDRSGHQQRESNNVHTQQRVRGEAMTAQLIMELELLARAEVLVCTLSSNYARLAHALRSANRAPNTTISLDTMWTPGVAFSAFHAPYCPPSTPASSISSRDAPSRTTPATSFDAAAYANRDYCASVAQFG